MPALHEQYRPVRWDDVAGQSEAVRAVRRVLARGWGGRAWWITGLSGVGKTTIGKLIAAEGASELTTELQQPIDQQCPRRRAELQAQLAALDAAT